MNGHQGGLGIRQRQSRQSLRPGQVAEHLLGGVRQIAGPPAGPQGGQLLLGAGGQLLRGGKGVLSVFQRAAAEGAQPLHQASNAGDVVVLAENKGAQRFKKGLAQHPNAGILGHTGRQPPVARLIAGQKGGVIHVQGKITAPEVPLGLVRPFQKQRVSLHAGQNRAAVHHAGPARRSAAPAKALAAVQGAVQLQSARMFQTQHIHPSFPVLRAGG